ncbi:hypothetical protein PT2222_150049 [Paraburkholderia tropica]
MLASSGQRAVPVGLTCWRASSRNANADGNARPQAATRVVPSSAGEFVGTPHGSDARATQRRLGAGRNEKTGMIDRRETRRGNRVDIDDLRAAHEYAL